MDKHIERLKGMLEHAEMRRYAYEERLKHGDGAAKHMMREAGGDITTLEWAIAVCEAAMRVQADTATDSLGDTPQPANRWYTVGPGAMERLFDAIEGKVNSGGDNT